MTESRWLLNNDPASMLKFLEECHDPEGRLKDQQGAVAPPEEIKSKFMPSERKLSLFILACGRLSKIDNGLYDALERFYSRDWHDRKSIATLKNYWKEIDWSPLRLARQWANPSLTYYREIIHFKQRAEILRDIFNPFYCGWPNMEDEFSPLWLNSNCGRIPKIARQIYEDQDWSAMPILADAMEEAGCEDNRLIKHLRTVLCWACLDADPYPYSRPTKEEFIKACKFCGGTGKPVRVRGDWVIDALLLRP